MKTYRYNSTMNATTLPHDVRVRITRGLVGVENLDGSSTRKMWECTLGEAIKNGWLSTDSGTASYEIELSPDETRVGDVVPTEAYYLRNTYPAQGEPGAPDLARRNTALVRLDGRAWIALTET